MLYSRVSFRMTLSDLEWLQWHCAASLRQLSFLFLLSHEVYFMPSCDVYFLQAMSLAAHYLRSHNSATSSTELEDCVIWICLFIGLSIICRVEQWTLCCERWFPVVVFDSRLSAEWTNDVKHTHIFWQDCVLLCLSGQYITAVWGTTR